MKITPDCKAIMIDDWRSEPDYADKYITGYSLSLPQFWKYKIFYLSAFILDSFDDDDIYNPLATMLFRKLKSPYGPNDEIDCGFMFICNEDEKDSELDFKTQDYEYILAKLQLFKYKERCDIIEWDRLSRAIDF